jgi:hypothetical protein
VGDDGLPCLEFAIISDNFPGIKVAARGILIKYIKLSLQKKTIIQEQK